MKGGPFRLPPSYLEGGQAAAGIIAPVSCVVAASYPSNGIGFKNDLPWKKELPLDMKYFNAVTSCTSSNSGKINAIIMGRKTWLSIPPSSRPLKGRVNIIVSGTMNDVSSFETSNEWLQGGDKYRVVKSVEYGIEVARNSTFDIIEHVFVVGGNGVYRRALELGVVSRIYLTRVLANNLQYDTYFPEIQQDEFKPVSVSISHCSSDKSLPFDFVIFDKKPGDASEQKRSSVGIPCQQLKFLNGVFGINDLMIPKTDAADTVLNRIVVDDGVEHRQHEEYQYLDCVANIIRNGDVLGDRTGTGILAVFGIKMKYNLRETFPLLTTKRVYWKAIVEELLWFIRGDTNGNNLRKVNVKIWEKNGSREFLDSLGFNERDVGDLGPIYGFQWRHFGAVYGTMHDDYTLYVNTLLAFICTYSYGIDQLTECINKIKTDPASRRIVLCAWNPIDIPKMALPPCHLLCQFFVSNEELSCLMYQRSADMGLGVPFNIASYSLLTCLMAHLCKLKPGDFIHCIGNGHVYLNHVEALKNQLKRTPLPFPTIKISQNISKLGEFQADDIELCNYNSLGKVSMEMAV